MSTLRRAWRSLPGIAALALACTTARAPTPSAAAVRDASIEPASAQADAQVLAFLELFGGSRTQAGCGPLDWDSAIARVAHAHAADMGRRQFFSHTNPDGRSPFDRLRDAGVAFRAAAENIARTAGPRDAHDGWLASPGHRANMLDCSFTHHGVGRSGPYWTHLFVQR